MDAESPSADTRRDEQSRERSSVDLLKHAADLRALYERDPHRGDAKELRRQEAVALLQAGFAGDETQKVRRVSLARELMADKSLDAKSRCEIAAYAGNLEVHLTTGLTLEQRLDQYEIVARRLAREFPDVEANFEALLQIAKARSTGGGLRLARELADMPVPPRLKRQAEEHAGRCELVGKLLGEILGSSAGGEELFSQAAGQSVILYSWSASIPATFEIAQQVASAAPAGTVVFGVNMDVDVATAEEAVRSHRLPGKQIYSVATVGGVACSALRITEPGLIYSTDEAGVIVSISAQDAWSRFVARRQSP